MATCEVCGNDYDKSFEVVAAGSEYTVVKRPIGDPDEQANT